jgi:hypothetical protein
MSKAKRIREGVSGGIAGGTIGAAVTKSPSGISVGYKLGSGIEDLFNADEETEEGQDGMAGVGIGNYVVDEDPKAAKSKKLPVSKSSSKQVPISESAEIAIRVLLTQLANK